MRFLEAHSPISAILVDKSDYDGIWISSLTQSAVKGLPDNELVSLKERVSLAQEIKNVSKKPIIADIDTGGKIEHLPYYIKWLSSVVYAVVIEDKCGLKKNSLLEDVEHQLEDVDIFCEKIKVMKANSKEMKVYARLESLIAKHSIYEALIRAEAYINAGVDGILIHSKEKVDAKEVMEFATKFRQQYKDITLLAIPTNYVLPKKHPFDITIDANHLFRASLKGMQNFLKGKGNLASIEDIFNIV